MFFGSQPGQSGKLTLENLRIQETGTYQNQYNRPYSVNLTDAAVGSLANRIENVTRGDPLNKISGAVIAGLSHGLIVPSIEAESLATIPNGWQESRLRFVLEVHASNAFGTEIFFFQGYTDYRGASLQGSIDPHMPFYINSFTRINRTIDPGFGTAHDIVAETAQVIDGRFVSSSHNTSTLYSLTPSSLFTGVQSNYLRQQYQEIEGAHLIDDRLSAGASAFQSRRANNIPSNYLARSIESHRQATNLADFGSGTSDIVGRAIQNSYESQPYENPFIRALGQIKGQGQTTMFTMSDLAEIDNTIGNRTDYMVLAPTTRLTSSNDVDDLWGNRTMETRIAAILSSGIAGLMSDNLLIGLAFTCTTFTSNGVPDCRIYPDSVQSMSTANWTMSVQNFLNRFEVELLPDITAGGMVPVSINIMADLNYEMRLEIKLGDHDTEVYVTPCFADAMVAPIMTMNQRNFNNLVGGFEQIMNNVSEGALASNPQGVIHI